MDGSVLPETQILVASMWLPHPGVAYFPYVTRVVILKNDASIPA